jgi:putative transposase
VARVRKIHRKVRNQRKDFHHKVARRLLEANDVIYHENLNVRAMARGNTAKGVMDAGWGQFLSILYGKAAAHRASGSVLAGRRVVGVNPAYTSQVCSACGNVQKVPIGKPYACGACGLVMHRDVNAALNILRMDGACTRPQVGRACPWARGMRVLIPEDPRSPRL